MHAYAFPMGPYVTYAYARPQRGGQMVHHYAQPSNTNSKNIATCTVPGDCGLGCSYCIIEQRGEREGNLSISDYLAHFEERDPDAIGVQGKEPLNPKGWPYTKAIIEFGHSKNIPVTFVTNGVFLAERIDEIVSLDPAGVTVSLDSFNQSIHDGLRGKSFDLIKAGLSDLVAKWDSRKIEVHSVLMPKRIEYLIGMPKFLNEISVKRWSITPHITIGKGFTDSDKNILNDLAVLQHQAIKHNVRFYVDDEFGRLPPSEFVVRVLDRDSLTRMTPDGSLYKGLEILEAA